MRLCLVEDHVAGGLEPISLTRPVFDLLLGAGTLGAKIARAVGVGPGPQRRGVVIRPSLSGVRRLRDPHTTVNDRDWLARGPVIVANGRWVPPADFALPDQRTPWLGLCDGQPALALVGPDDAARLEPNGVSSWFEQVAGRLGGIELGGEWIQRPWDLVAKNAAHLERDFHHDRKPGVTNRHLTTFALVGPVDRLSIHETARI
ncbi:MAG: putative sugar nucleotidyl transferase, partial [Isosphaeraceae bacterium]